MTPEIITLIKEIGVTGGLFAFLLFSSVRFANTIIPILKKHNDELTELIMLNKEMLEILRSQKRR